MGIKNQYVRAREKNGLTPAELKIIGKLAEGVSGKAIGVSLGKSSRTVSTQMRKLMNHTKVRNHFELGVWAARHGYVPENA